MFIHLAYIPYFRAVRRGAEPVHLQADEEERADQLGPGHRQLVRRGRTLQQQMGQAVQVSPF